MATVWRGEEWVVHVIEEQDHGPILARCGYVNVRHSDIDDVADCHSELKCVPIADQSDICASESIRSYGRILLSTDQPDVERYSCLMVVTLMLMLLMVIRLLVVFVS